MRRFKNTDWETIRDWYKDRGLVCNLKGLDTGYIVPGTAAGFLVKTSSYFCLIEGLITNRRKDQLARHQAIKSIVEGLMNMAKHCGFQAVYVITKDTDINKRCEWAGGERIGEGFVVWRKELC